MKKKLALFLLGIGSLVAVSVNAATTNEYQESTTQNVVVPCNTDTVCAPEVCTPAPCYTDTVCNGTPENPEPCATPVAQPVVVPGCC